MFIRYFTDVDLVDVRFELDGNRIMTFRKHTAPALRSTTSMTPKQTRIKTATDFIRAVAKHPQAYPDSFISLPMDPDLIATVLSRERTRLVQYLERHGPAVSVHALADALDRNYASVSRDLGVLIDIGLIESQLHGKQKQITATHRPILIGGNAEHRPRAA